MKRQSLLAKIEKISNLRSKKFGRIDSSVLNFTNILWAHLRRYSCAKKSSNLNLKDLCVKCWWNRHLVKKYSDMVFRVLSFENTLPVPFKSLFHLTVFLCLHRDNNSNYGSGPAKWRKNSNLFSCFATLDKNNLQMIIVCCVCLLIELVFKNRILFNLLPFFC